MKLDRPATDYIFTYSGEAIYPPEVRIDQIKLIDIAYGLAGINRYNGQTRISVLRHSLGLAGLVKAINGRAGYCQDPVEEELYALVHDGAEAYVMDVPVPQKPFMSQAWRDSYARFEYCIFKKFKLTPSEGTVCAVGSLDKQLVQYEMETRCVYEPGSKIAYPNAITVDREFIRVAAREYRWDLTDAQLIPVFLQKVSELSGVRYD